MRIKQGIMRTLAVLAAGATLLGGASMASATEPREYDLSGVGTASLSGLTDANGKTKTYTTPDGATVTGAGMVSGDGTLLFGLDVAINDLGGVNPGDKIRVPFHTTDESYIPLTVGAVQSSGYLSVNGTRVFTVKPAGTVQQGNGSTVMDGLILTALNSVSRYSGKAAMDTTLTANVYPGRSTHFGRTSTALTVGDRTYTIPNAAQLQSRNISNASRIIGVGAQAGSETLQMSADSYGWQHAVLSGDQYADAVRKKFDTVRVALAKITPKETDTEIQSITPTGDITPDDLVAGYDATTWSNTFVESKTLAGTMKLATLTAADMQSADTVAAKLPAHQAAIVHDGRDWYVAVNFGSISDDTKLPASQSGYGDKATQDLYDNVRAASLPYPSMTANFTVTFNDPAKQQTARIARSHNTAWGQGLPVTVETKVYDQGWDLGIQPVSAEGSGSAADAVTGTFDANGGTAVDSQKIKVGDTLAEPYTQRDGFTFDGWYLNGVRYDFATPVTKDITLKSAWRRAGTTSAENDGRASKTIAKTGDGVYTETLKAVVKAGMSRPSLHETLGADVTAPALSDGKADGITVQVDGKAATGYKASYTARTRTVGVAFQTTPAEGSAITVTYTLELSDKAKSAYTNEGAAAYDATGDKDTGTTSAGRKGFSTGTGTLDWDEVDMTGGAPVTTPTSTGLPKAVVQAAASLPVATDGLPGTGSARAITPILVAGGLALAAGSAIAIRRLRRGARA